MRNLRTRLSPNLRASRYKTIIRRERYYCLPLLRNILGSIPRSWIITISAPRMCGSTKCTIVMDFYR